MSGAALIIATAAIEEEAADARAQVEAKLAAIESLPEHGDPGRAAMNAQMAEVAAKLDEARQSLVAVRQAVAAL